MVWLYGERHKMNETEMITYLLEENKKLKKEIIVLVWSIAKANNNRLEIDKYWITRGHEAKIKKYEDIRNDKLIIEAV